MIMDKYWNAIKNWHDKADKADDPFIKFILEYISFIALLNKKIPIVQDRPKIQKLKDNNTLKRLYLDNLDRSILINLMDYLEEEPIINVTHPDDSHWDGKLQSSKDYRSIIEFIYRTRNNLFHGHKHLDYNRDLIIVKHAYNVLRPLMKILLQNDDIIQFS